MICASVTDKTVAAMVRTANRVNADVVELRLDYLKDSSRIEKLSSIKKPVIATCMPVWEGGRFKGTESQRIKVLEDALSFASYVTIELKTAPHLRARIIKASKIRNVTVIVAFHDFSKTPSKRSVESIIARELQIGDIAKVAFTSKDAKDVLTLMNVLAEKKPCLQVIALSLGSLGRISRVLGPMLGSYLTYGSVSKNRQAGPGQMTVSELKEIFIILGRK
jgi:3-dehydroquinate dehydratase type I